jgi:hypothetical protein
MAIEEVVPQADQPGHTEIAARQGREGQQSTEAFALSGTLTAADKKIIGATVYNSAGEALGTVDDLILDLPSGRVAYAVLSFGGLLGLGKQYHPVPWELLKYTPENEAFLIDLEKERLGDAPTHGLDFEWTRRYASEIDTHYGINRPPPTV